MKILILLVMILLTSLSLPAQDLQRIVTVHLENEALSTFAEEISKQTGIKVWAREEWADSVKVTINQQNISLEQAFTIALQNTGLSFSPWHGDIVILQGEKLLTRLPDFNKSAIEKEVVAKNPEVTQSEDRYITGKKTKSAEVIRIGRQGGPLIGNKARISGYIFDEETGEPLFNATIFITETKSGAVSDMNGYLTFLLKPGRYNGVFEILGYEKKAVILDVQSDGQFRVSLGKAVINIKEFVVYGDRQMNIKSKDPGIEKISMKAVKELPMMMGERDILKISGMLPGIVSTGEGTAGLNVRGGGSDQNAFYINKIPVYNTSHLFGFFPAFNSDIIKDFAIYKGHIPANYGGRLSSVFNIVTKQGNRKKFTARGGVSPITASLVAEGPIWKDKSSILLSYRTSYSDWILKKIKDPDIRASSANFSDLAGGISFEAGKNHISLFGYHSNDKFSLADLTEYEYKNDGAALNFASSISNSIRSEFTLLAAEYSFKTIDSQQEPAAYEHAYKLGHYEFRAQFHHLVSDVHNLDYGTGVVYYHLNRGEVLPYGPESLLEPVRLGIEKGTEGFVYFSDSWDVNNWLNITTGLRYTAYIPLGPQKVFTYLPDYPVDIRYIDDTINFANNRFIKWYHQPDLRVAVNIETDVNGSIKLAFNRAHQNLFMLNNAITIAPNTQWKLADYHLKPSESNQISAGLFRLFPEKGLDGSIETYYKQTVNYPEFKDGANFLDSPQAETNTLQGKQHAYGIEVMVKRNNRKLDGWLSYTWSKALTRVNGKNEWDKINNGAEYQSNYDIPHAVNLVMNYHLSRRITFSSVIVYQSGRPVTYPVSIYYVRGIPYMDYSARNAYRIPDYFRTDLSMTIEGNLRKKKLLHSSLSISVYNLTGRDNPNTVFFRNEKGRIKSYMYSVIGAPILTATWMFKLGNYATE